MGANIEDFGSNNGAGEVGFFEYIFKVATHGSLFDLNSSLTHKDNIIVILIPESCRKYPLYHGTGKEGLSEDAEEPSDLLWALVLRRPAWTALWDLPVHRVLTSWRRGNMGEKEGMSLM